MAKLSDENWSDIDQRIKAATSARWLHGLKNYGAAGAFMTACVAVAIFVVTQINGNSKFQGATEEHFKGIELQLISLRALTSSNQPLRKANQDAAKELLAEARQKDATPIPLPVLEQSGRSFIEASAENAGALAVANDFLAYRTSLNAREFPRSEQAAYKSLPADEKGSFYEWGHVPGKEDPKQSASGPVPFEDSARAERIGHQLNAGHAAGNGSILFVGGAMRIDGMLIRHAVLMNVEVYYSGAPLITEDVLFINCSFVFDGNPNARTFGEQILAQTKVTATIG